MLLSGERAIVIDELTKPYKVLLFESRNKNNKKIIKMKYGKKQATVSIVTPKPRPEQNQYWWWWIDSIFTPELVKIGLIRTWNCINGSSLCLFIDSQ